MLRKLFDSRQSLLFGKIMGDQVRAFAARRLEARLMADRRFEGVEHSSSSKCRERLAGVNGF
jgi:hypothetical protein